MTPPDFDSTAARAEKAWPEEVRVARMSVPWEPDLHNIVILLDSLNARQNATDERVRVLERRVAADGPVPFDFEDLPPLNRGTPRDEHQSILTRHPADLARIADLEEGLRNAAEYLRVASDALVVGNMPASAQQARDQATIARALLKGGEDG